MLEPALLSMMFSAAGMGSGPAGVNGGFVSVFSHDFVGHCNFFDCDDTRLQIFTSVITRCFFVCNFPRFGSLCSYPYLYYYYQYCKYINYYSSATEVDH